MEAGGARRHQQAELAKLFGKCAATSVIPVHDALCCVPAAEKPELGPIAVGRPAFSGDLNKQSPLGNRGREVRISACRRMDHRGTLLQRRALILLVWKAPWKNPHHLIRHLERRCGERDVSPRRRVKTARKNREAAWLAGGTPLELHGLS